MALYKTFSWCSCIRYSTVDNKKVNIPVSNINHSLYVYIQSIYCNTRHVLTPQCINFCTDISVEECVDLKLCY